MKVAPTLARWGSHHGLIWSCRPGGDFTRAGFRLHVRDAAAPDRHVRSLPVVPVGLRRAVRIALRLFEPAPRALAARVALDDERQSVRRPRTGRGHRGKEVVEPRESAHPVKQLLGEKNVLRGEREGEREG